MPELRSIIKRSILKHAERGGVRKCWFYFGLPGNDYGDFFNDESLGRVREVLSELGLDAAPCDTVPWAFCLNQDFEEVHCDAVREFGFTLPYVEPTDGNLDLLCELCNLVWSGRVQCICEWDYGEKEECEDA